MPTLDRRRFLGLLGLTGAATQLGACKDPAPADPTTRERDPEPTTAWTGSGTVDAARFPLSVQAGAPTNSALVCWTRYAETAALELHHAVWTDGAWLAATPVTATPAEGGFTHVELTGLPADAWVSYQFVDGTGASSPIGLARTAPAADDPASITLGVCSCLHQDHEVYPALTHLRGRGPLDLFLFLGDTAYFDGRSTREAFRELYALQLVREGFDAVLPTTATVHTWDDHEFANNFDPTTLDPDLLNTARESWFEHLPVRRDPAHPERIWHSVRHGKAVELFVLDCRTERDPATNRYLSRAQLDWLKQGLAASDATWKLIANSVPMVSFESPAWDIPRILGDRWEGHPEQRAELLDFLVDQEVEGVLFLSGDVHCAMIAHVDATGPRGRFLDLVCGPGGSTLNVVAPFLMSPQIPWAAAAHNAVRIELRADGLANATVIGENDEDLATMTLDTTGQILVLRALDPETGEMLDLTPAAVA
jgi:alkaline phosphatase D